MYTQIIGIVNATPDSFSDGGAYDPLTHAKELSQYADIIDIGGESTRPGAPLISLDEELNRVIPVIEALDFPFISIDTRKPEVARQALDAGAFMINDIEGLQNPEMRKIAREYGAKVCVMHMQGTPQTMQNAPHYPRGVVIELIAWFKERLALLIADGLNPTKIIIDPGIGFGKTVEDNVKILQNLDCFKALGYPILIGLSRKSFMKKILNQTDLLIPTLAMSCDLAVQEINYLRVHDVKEHRQALSMLEAVHG